MRVPAMALAGESDLVSPPALMRLQAERIPSSRFVSLPEAGTRRLLGASAGVERPGAGVHWSALGEGSSNGSLKCEKRTSIVYW